MIKLMTVNEACEILKVSRPTLYKLIVENNLTAKKIGNHWRITYESIENFINEDTNIIENMFRR